MRRKQALEEACFLLRKQAKEENLAKFLLQYILEEDNNEFIFNINNDLDVQIYYKYIKLIKEHIEYNKPLSHLVGFDFFYGRKFFVNKDVLSPRMETEELVEVVIKYIKERFANKLINILDLCTGSGVIAITLAKELSNINLTASDISKEALDIAKKNANINDVKIKFIESDLFKKINKKFDVIVSNPPYIAYEDEKNIDDIVLNYDPHLALFAKENGIYYYRKILEQAKKYLNCNGIIFFEIGYNQKDKINTLAKLHNYKSKFLKDINGKDRIAILEVM